MGTEKDYYIIEGSAPAAEDGLTRTEEFEARGSGVNTYAYWVSCHPAGPWEALDDLEPVDLAASRTFKVAFTGDLDRDIVTNPYYFKKERHYLRAQIARITQTCKLMPAGTYRTKEDDPLDVEENIPEEGDNPVAPVPTTDQMCSLSSWVHFGQNILQCNRLKHMELNPETTELKEGEELEDVMKRVVAADPFEARLKPITQDKGCKGNYPAWVLRNFGDKDSYRAANPAHANMQYGVVVVKSTIWPGALSYFWKGTWGDIYIGDGHKHEDKTYFPIEPPMIMDDPDEKPDQPEPRPSDNDLETNERMQKITAMVDEIWAKYDADGNGSLDKEESYKLAIETAQSFEATATISEAEFDTIFA